MEKVLFGSNCGQGFILKNDEPIQVLKENALVAGEVLTPGTFTTMSGYFLRPLEFCGIVEGNGLVFHMGDARTGADKKRYYQLVHLISEFRLFSMFSFLSGRDFDFKNGKWK